MQYDKKMYIFFSHFLFQTKIPTQITLILINIINAVINLRAWCSHKQKYYTLILLYKSLFTQNTSMNHHIILLYRFSFYSCHYTIIERFRILQVKLPLPQPARRLYISVIIQSARRLPLPKLLTIRQCYWKSNLNVSIVSWIRPLYIEVINIIEVSSQVWHRFIFYS